MIRKSFESVLYNIGKEIMMNLSKNPIEIAALLQAYVAQNDDQSSAADDILSLAAELLVYSNPKTVNGPAVKTF